MRFFFNLHGRESVIHDFVGLDLPSIEKAVRETFATFQAIAVDALLIGEEITLEAIAIVDESGLTIQTVHLREVLTDLFGLLR